MFEGKLESTIQGFREILERIAEPDRGGLDDTTHRYIDLGHRYGLGIMEGSLGMTSALGWAEEIEKDPLHEINAWRIRMVYYLRQGDVQKGEQCKKKIELLQIQNSPSQFYEGSHLYPELVAGALCEDLARVKLVIDGMETMASRFRPWVPILYFARGEYQRIRGDFQSALGEHERALKLMAPGKHLTWPHATGAYLKTLCEFNRTEEARTVGERCLAQADREGLRGEANFIRMPLALIEAQLGDYDKALAICNAAMEIYRRLGATGMNPGIAYEVRARIAVLMGDREGFDTYANLCAKEYKAGHNRALSAKYEKLMLFARQAGIGVSTDLEHAADPMHQTARTMSSMITDGLSDCRDAEERAHRVIDMLIQQSNSIGGYLYIVKEDGPTLCARSSASPPPDQMETIVRDYLAAETEERQDATATCADLKAQPLSRFDCSVPQDGEYRLTVLGHNSEEGYAITGLAVLFIDPNEIFRYRNDLIAALSKSLYDAGDAKAIIAA
jgi:tetratricopeptide (TPR) repeat protein